MKCDQIFTFVTDLTKASSKKGFIENNLDVMTILSFEKRLLCEGLSL